jgi:transcriptional regulator with XRE-family HTH domain
VATVHTVRLLDQSGLTDREIGQRIGVSQQSVNRWRRGEQVPGLERAAALAEALGVSETKITAAIVTDLKQRNAGSTDAEHSTATIMAVAAQIALDRGVSAMSARTVAEAGHIPITDIARTWRTRDDLTSAVLDHALTKASRSTLRTVLAAHLDTIVRLGPRDVWSLPGMHHAVGLAGGIEALTEMVGAEVIGRPELVGRPVEPSRPRQTAR